MTTDPPVACVAIAVPPALLARIRGVATVVSPPIAAPREAILALLADAEGLLCSNLLPIDAALMDAAPRLRVVSNFGVGYNNVDLEEATRRGIAICNTPGVLTEAVADLTLGLILSLSRRLVENADFVRTGNWGKTPPPPLGFDLGGRTLGIVGFGRIGRAVAKRALAFGMQVLYHDVDTWPEPGVAAEPRSLEDLLRESDVVSLHVNLTPETHHLIGASQLSLMKPGAYLVNTSRGPVVDQAALLDALRFGRIAGAGLDVLEVEPPAADEPLLALPNVVVFPHVGSATAETRAAMMELAVGNLVAVLGGQPPPACVNPETLAKAIQRR
ncbi:MAG: D-glycerate dehydrogenase [Chloroflexi bacterium]|nr:D-glycerate dehydrogenase [Chloroflexota bacterium]